MHWTYAVWNLVIGGGTALAAWLWLPEARHLWRPMIRGWLLVSIPWIVLDALSVAYGWWNYNPQYVLGYELLGLPIEEIAFFITVPYACMVVYLLLSRHVAGRVVSIHKIIVVTGIGMLLVIGAWIYAERLRTVVDILIAIATLIVLLGTKLSRFRVYWVWVAVVMLLCGIFNGVLTGLPVVLYDQQAMSGLRIGAIPVEDFLYNFSFLTLTALVVRPDRLAAPKP